MNHFKYFQLCSIHSKEHTHTHAHMSDKSISHESAAHATSKRTQKCFNGLESFTTTQLIIFMSSVYVSTNILRFTKHEVFKFSEEKMYNEKIVASEEKLYIS